MKEILEYVPLRLEDSRKYLGDLKMEMEVREHEFDWLASKLRDMVFPLATGHSKPDLNIAVGVGLRKCYIWIYGITAEMACVLAGEIEERTGCEMVKYTSESDWGVNVEYKFKGIRAGREITFDFCISDVEGCRIEETVSTRTTRKVVCS